ncbi:MAG: DUF402 domain-containing protein [Thermoplasmata archaeon]|nr:DUF402 domain-containing protein [Thermoplasmata archaeon]
MEKIELVAIRPGKPTEVWVNEKVYEDLEVVVSLFDFSGLKKEFVVDGRVVIDRTCKALCADFIGKPYEILVVLDKGDSLRGYYVNINRNIVKEGNKVTVHDLFLDIWVSPDMRWKVLDRDEFEDARKAGLLTLEDVALAEKTLGEIVGMVENGQFREIIEGLHKLSFHSVPNWGNPSQ